MSDQPRITDKRGQQKQQPPPAPQPADPSLLDDRMEQLRLKGAREGLDDAERQELLDLQALEDEARRSAPAAQDVLTAFLVLIGHDGSAVALADLNTPVTPERPATLDDMFSGSSIIVRDLQASLSGRAVMAMMAQQAQIAQQQAMAAQLANGQVNIGGSRRR